MDYAEQTLGEFLDGVSPEHSTSRRVTEGEKRDSTYGPAYDPKLDGQRLGEQGERILKYMLSLPWDTWSTLAEIEQATGYPQASLSAWLRHFRKPKFGSYTVDKRRRTDGEGTSFGTWEYWVHRG
jgi:hypothetical protein